MISLVGQDCDMSRYLFCILRYLAFHISTCYGKPEGNPLESTLFVNANRKNGFDTRYIAISPATRFRWMILKLSLTGAIFQSAR